MQRGYQTGHLIPRGLPRPKRAVLIFLVFLAAARSCGTPQSAQFELHQVEDAGGFGIAVGLAGVGIASIVKFFSGRVAIA